MVPSSMHIWLLYFVKFLMIDYKVELSVRKSGSPMHFEVVKVINIFILKCQLDF